MVGWHHRLDAHEFGQILGDGEEQGSLLYCSRWGHRVRYDLATEQQQKYKKVKLSDSEDPVISEFQVESEGIWSNHCGAGLLMDAEVWL